MHLSLRSRLPAPIHPRLKRQHPHHCIQINRLFFSGHEAQAYQEIQAFCKKYPGQIEAYQRMASLALEMDDNEGYCQACAKAMALQPKDEERIYTFALALYTQAQT
ncbi:MAG: hypothetical protein HC860_04960 [Alkalinema sp. RU_4_3]|nr:hypothetical protein [Alkalinema sp. RU_4_3]